MPFDWYGTVAVRTATHFKPPPLVELGAAESAQRIELGVDETLYIVQADVQNCFYQISLPLWMTPYFAWDRIVPRERLSMWA